ncbi:hypothetical protein HNY73_018260 [Argiope bruennichi]|uniref:Uncharacterized protein n=1 Tax=Argiope bruennichi TaxID=94029 RepID=A0A8T0EDP4_ARGBR|nr:hypothetical protein HNY73_018260 [Argiope bruennichi]
MWNKKKVEFSEYAKNLYSNSLVTGIPEIVIANNWRVRLIRLAIFICCIVGFIYQSLDFMDLYWKYPTILDIQITRKDEIMMPAITACDANGVRLSLYCKHYPCRKPLLEHRFCRCYPAGRYCNRRELYPGIMIPLKVGDISRTFFLAEEDRRHLMPRGEDFVTSCSLNRPPLPVVKNCGNLTLAPACPNKINEPTACFSINSVYGHPQKKPPNISASTAIEFELFSPPIEYDPALMEMYKQVSLHSPYALSNPFVEGLLLRSERSYKIFVKQTVKHLMGPPYDTNCFDYLEEWRRNGGRGPPNRSDCVQLCKKKSQMSQTGGCVPTNIWYPSNEKRCYSGTKWCADYGMSFAEECKQPSWNNEKIERNETNTCETECRPACWPGETKALKKKRSCEREEE